MARSQDDFEDGVSRPVSIPIESRDAGDATGEGRACLQVGGRRCAIVGGNGEMSGNEQSTARMLNAVNREERAGLGILYAKPDARDDMPNVGMRDLTAELRERYWIARGKDAGIGRATWGTVSSNLEWKIERQELGRSRNKPGDGFRHAVWVGSGGIDARTEWFEVTKVFAGVEARDVEAFMRIQNGYRPFGRRCLTECFVFQWVV